MQPIKVHVNKLCLGKHFMLKQLQSPWACHLLVVVRLVCLDDPRSQIGHD